MDPAEWPEGKIVERPDALPAYVIERTNALRAECARIAKELEIAAATLAPRAALEAIARSRPGASMKLWSMALLRWQAELVEGASRKMFALDSLLILWEDFVEEKMVGRLDLNQRLHGPEPCALPS